MTAWTIHQTVLEIPTSGRSFINITDRVKRVVGASGVDAGLCVLFIQHTSASLLIQENADSSVQRDLQKWLSDVAPESHRWEHDAEGPDDMPGHLRSSMLRTSENIPIVNRCMMLGTWQGIYVLEHRTSPHVRKVVVHVQGQPHG